MKKIIIFDADGTLWYPKVTKYNEPPWLIYRNPKMAEDPSKHLTLIPKVKTTLKKLKEKGIILVIISQSPYPKRLANQRLKKIVSHFSLTEFFDVIRASHSSIKKNEADPKDAVILEVLKRKSMPKAKALLIGDSYNNDYLSAKRCGIDCLLINSFKHTKGNKNYSRVGKKIGGINDIFKYINK